MSDSEGSYSGSGGESDVSKSVIIASDKFFFFFFSTTCNPVFLFLLYIVQWLI